ncbi:MAG: hypothetical protein PVJ69_17220 [Desulfobacteraceae bacterium]|jgi:hypothetical protein
MANFRFYFPGITLILIAIAIIAVPEILVAFIAAAIIVVGIALLYMGHIARKTEIEMRDSGEWVHGDGFFDGWFARAPVYRRRHRRF